MTYYPPTTLPPSPPYANYDAIVHNLCDQCLKITNCDSPPCVDQQQFFEVVMSLIDFWEKELLGTSSR